MYKIENAMSNNGLISVCLTVDAGTHLGRGTLRL